MATVQEDVLAGLEGFSGQLLRPTDERYDETRSVHNGLIDRRPAAIARCRGTADVAAAVNAARQSGARDLDPRWWPQRRRQIGD